MEPLALSLALVLLAAAQEPAAPPRGVADVFAAGAETCWAIEQAGQRLGQCASRYEGEVALGSLRAHHFREQVRLELPAPSGKIEQRITVLLWTDERGHPLRFELRTQLGDPSLVAAHRLDRQTSGVALFARGAAGAWASRAFALRQVRKRRRRNC